MKLKYTLRVAFILPVALLFTILTGCSSREISETNYNDPLDYQMTSFTAIGPQNFQEERSIDPNIYTSPEIPIDSLHYELSNGIRIRLNSYRQGSDFLLIRLHYSKNDGNELERILKINSLAGATLMDTSGSILFDYAFDLIDSNQVAYRASTGQDSIQFNHSITDGEINTIYNYDGRSYTLQYKDKEEFYRAKELYQLYYGDDNISTLPADDQGLINRIAGLEEFFNWPSSFNNNLDAEATVYLMANHEFISWVKGNGDFMTRMCGRECICGIAGLISLTSSFFGPLVFALAIPAHGVVAACGITVIIEMF